jgi:RNA polymerase sigma-70 factor (sigma-E family)
MRSDDDFREFVLSRTPSLSRAAYLLTGDHHLAQDLLQTVLATTYQHWSRVRDGHPDAYVRRAMHNTHISWWRKRAGLEVGPLDAELALPAARDAVESSALRMTVVAALRALTPRQRTVVVLRYFEDLTEVQTAEVLGCSVGTVKRLHFDALAKLRTVAPHLLADERPVRV